MTTTCSIGRTPSNTSATDAMNRNIISAFSEAKSEIAIVAAKLDCSNNNNNT